MGVRSFASGYQGEENSKPAPTSEWTSADQESLVQFHAHQFQTLIGPTAILSELRTSVTVLSTAIMLFRRFYLSNSCVQFHPRKMAAACALFAAKLEEEKIEIGLLSHATAVVQLTVKNAPLCFNELMAVSIPEIEEYERFLMHGLNYQFRCHHPFSAMHALAIDFANFQGERDEDEEVLERASAVAQRALIFSDVHFLFAPGHVGFSVMAVALGSRKELSAELHAYLEDRFSLKPTEDLDEFIETVNEIITALVKNPLMDLADDDYKSARFLMAQRAENMKRVMALAARQRPPERCSFRRKRSRAEIDFTPPRRSRPRYAARVTPIYCDH